MKTISWCWVLNEIIAKIESRGENITEAYLNLSKTDRDLAVKRVKWIEIDGRRI